MTLNGFLREVGAAHRRAVRNEERRQRLQARAAKLQAKIDAIERAQEEAAEYQEKVTQLTTIHHNAGESMDWTDLAQKASPVVPVKGTHWTDAAIAKRDSFKPNFLVRVFGSEKKIRDRLAAAIITAQHRDELDHQGAQKIYQHQFKQWTESSGFARSILNGDVNAYIKALEELEPLSEMQEMGCSIVSIWFSPMLKLLK